MPGYVAGLQSDATTAKLSECELEGRNDRDGESGIGSGLFSSQESDGEMFGGCSGTVFPESPIDAQGTNRPGSYYASGSGAEKDNDAQVNGMRRRSTAGGNYLPRNARSHEPAVRKENLVGRTTWKKVVKRVCSKSLAPSPQSEDNRMMVDHTRATWG